MKTTFAILTAVLTLALTQTSHATSRYPHYSTSVSCSQLQTDLQTAGSLIIYRAPHLYDRYVAHAGYCYSGDIGQFTTLPTRDGYCSVMTCIPDPR